MPFFRLNASSGVPLYLQLMEQVKHAVETGALRAGDQLPTIRKLAEELVMNPNTVVRAYRELEHEGFVELRHGLGAFISESAEGRGKLMRKAQVVVQAAVDRLRSLGATEDEIRRLFENELARCRRKNREGGKHERLDHRDRAACARSSRASRRCAAWICACRSGSIFGFLGRNGAGKTTTIKALMGFLSADGGAAACSAMPVTEAAGGAEIRRRIGFVTEDKELYPYMTVEQIIRFTRPFFPRWRDDLERRYLEIFDLPPKPQNSAAFERYALQADAAAGDLPRRGAADSG